MGNNTTLGGQQSFFVKQNGDGNYDMVVATYNDGDKNFALGALIDIHTSSVSVVTASDSDPKLDNGSGSKVNDSYDIIEYTVKLSDLNSVDGTLKGTTGDSSTMITFSLSRVVSVKYVVGAGGSPGSVVFGVVDLESY